MSIVKTPWVVNAALAFAALILALAVLLIFQSFQADKTNTTPLLGSSSVASENAPVASIAPTLSDSIPTSIDSSSFPAPTKKLHQLINENESSLDATASAALEQKIKDLDQQLSLINQQLQARGISAPPVMDTPGLNVTDTERRLAAIREYMNNKSL